MRNKFACVSDPSSFVSSSGDRFHVIYSPKVNPDGSIDLVASSKIDIQESIDSFLPSTDFSWILSRLMSGDTSVLNQREPMYGDFTSMPSTYAEALQLVIDRESQFNQLPLDVRNSFDNDFRKWFASSGSEDWLSKMKPVLSGYDEALSDVSKEDSQE